MTSYCFLVGKLHSFQAPLDILGIAPSPELSAEPRLRLTVKTYRVRRTASPDDACVASYNIEQLINGTDFRDRVVLFVKPFRDRVLNRLAVLSFSDQTLKNTSHFCFDLVHSSSKSRVSQTEKHSSRNPPWLNSLMFARS